MGKEQFKEKKSMLRIRRKSILENRRNGLLRSPRKIMLNIRRKGRKQKKGHAEDQESEHA